MIKSDYKNYINPKNIFISRIETIKSLKQKVFRCLSHIMKKKDCLSFDTHEMQIIRPDLHDKKKDLFEIVASYANGNNLIEVEGDIIDNDTSSIQVSNNSQLRDLKYRIILF